MVISSSKFNFAEVVNKYLTQYGQAATGAMFEAIDEVSKEAVKKLKASSRAQFGSGDYAKGWTRKIERGRVNVYATVYGNKPTYALAHLLEYGHVTRNGTGRTFPRTPAYPHIQEVEEWAIDEAIDRTIEKAEGIE